MAWSNTIQGLILAKKMNSVLGMLKKHDDLLKMEPSNADDTEILSIMAKNDKALVYINSGLTLIEHRSCVSATKS
jgi:hypothetical protein